MKNLFLLLTSYITFGQCDRVATNFGNNSSTPTYNVTGTVQVRLNTNNTLTITLDSNFSTAAGPDVKVFLVDRGTLTDVQLKTPSMFNTRPKIQFGQVNATGAQTFTQPIPSGFNVSELDTVYFLCQQFNAFWDFGKFTEFTQANCLALDNEVFESEELVLYPNPVSNQLFIKSNEFNSYKIYNSIGSLVMKEENFKNDFIDFSELNSGLYFIEFNNKDAVYRKSVLKK